jgi:hypothetical protein
MASAVTGGGLRPTVRPDHERSLLTSADQGHLYTAILVVGVSLALLLIALAVGAIVTGSKSKKPRRALERIEPKLAGDRDSAQGPFAGAPVDAFAPGPQPYPAPVAMAEPEQPVDRYGRSDEVRPERKFEAGPVDVDTDGRRPRHGVLKATVAFIVGVIVGAGLYAVARQPHPLRILRSLADQVTVLTRSSVPPPVSPNPQDHAGEDLKSRAATPLSDAVAARLATYVARTNRALPATMDANTSMVFAKVKESVLFAGFQISSVISDDEVEKFSAFIKSKVEATICKLPKDDDLRYFNDNGVKFDFSYMDSTGRTIVKFGVPPNFC